MSETPPHPTSAKYRAAGPQRDSRKWVDCMECSRPGHPLAEEIARDGIWYCLDCRDPEWRFFLPPHDPRRRERPQQGSRPPLKLLIEGD